MPIEEWVLGPEHPATLMDRHRPAHWTGEAGNAARARDQYATLLPVFERVLGDEYPETLAARHHLVYRAEQAGSQAQAGMK